MASDVRVERSQVKWNTNAGILSKPSTVGSERMPPVRTADRILRTVVMVTIGVIAIAVGARIGFALPGTDVPQTGQTLVVLIVGVALGPVSAGLSVALYIFLGLVGLPVFADGSSGPSVLGGPTGGYLVGFVVAVVMVGWWSRSRFADRLTTAFAGMISAHGVIFLLGWLRLAWLIGPERAYTAGVQPFLIGAVVKSLMAALVCWIVAKRRGERREQIR